MTAPKTMDPDELRAELAEVEHLCRTLDPRTRAYVGRLLADRDHHAAELERRHRQWATMTRQTSEELALECDEVDRLTAEVERLRPMADALRGELMRLARSSAALAEGHMATDRPNDVGAARCVGMKDAYVNAAGLLAVALKGVSPRASEGARDECEGPGNCHGSLVWCERCGVVSHMCGDPDCDEHSPTGLERRGLASEGAATPPQTALDVETHEQMLGQYAAAGRAGGLVAVIEVELPDPDDMHGACDGFGGSDY